MPPVYALFLEWCSSHFWSLPVSLMTSSLSLPVMNPDSREKGASLPLCA